MTLIAFAMLSKLEIDGARQLLFVRIDRPFAARFAAVVGRGMGFDHGPLVRLRGNAGGPGRGKNGGEEAFEKRF